MSDKYLDVVQGGLGKRLAKSLGLPQPAKLRRTDPNSIDSPLTVGPVLVLTGPGASTEAVAVTDTLLAWDVDVRREAHSYSGSWGAIVLVLTGNTRPSDLTETALALGGELRNLAPSARVLTISGDPAATSDPVVAAARNGIDGFVRSLAKEQRRGATANGILIGAEATIESPAVKAALRFFLSARSAFVSGQMLPVVSNAGLTPASWTEPLAGMVAVVTGAARGIGAETARTLARDGAHVLGVDVASSGEALAATMNAAGGIALHADVTSHEAATRIAETAKNRWGHLDVVVHNAGILRDKMLVNMTEDKFADLLAVNVQAPLDITGALIEHGLLGGSAHPARIISLASTSGIAGNRGQTNYAAAKAGLIGMTRALRGVLHHADESLSGSVNAVAPGFIETEMTASIPPMFRQVARRSSSLRQGGAPVDVAEAISFLAWPASGGIDGQVLRVCGQNTVGQ